MDTLLDFSNKVAVITGAASGFGRLLAQGLSARGCQLVLGDIDIEAMQETLASLDLKEGQKVICKMCDVRDEVQCKSLVDEAIEHFGHLDIAINNAGIAHPLTPLHEISAEIMQQQVAVNLDGVLFGMKHQISQMLTQTGGGHVLNVASMAGIGGAPKGGAYAAVKHGVVGLTRTAAVEYARKGIQVNAICPFYSPTKILATDGFDSPENLQRLAQGSPMKRLPDPQEVVNTMLLILSPGNAYMTGQTIAIDGGVSAW